MLLKLAWQQIVYRLNARYSCYFGKKFNLNLKDKVKDIGLKSKENNYYKSFLITDESKERIYSQEVFIFKSCGENLKRIDADVDSIYIFDPNFLPHQLYRFNITRLTITNSKVPLTFSWLPETLKALDVFELDLPDKVLVDLQNIDLDELKIRISSLNLSNLKYISQVKTIKIMSFVTHGCCRVRLDWKWITTYHHIYYELATVLNPLSLNMPYPCVWGLEPKLLPRLKRMQGVFGPYYTPLTKIKSLRWLTVEKHGYFPIDFRLFNPKIKIKMKRRDLCKEDILSPSVTII